MAIAHRKSTAVDQEAIGVAVIGDWVVYVKLLPSLPEAVQKVGRWLSVNCIMCRCDGSKRLLAWRPAVGVTKASAYITGIRPIRLRAEA